MTIPRQSGAPPQSRTAYVLGRLRDDLADGVIQPGEVLKQTVIAERYGVSPTPVREALRILEADGTIDYAHHRGATVRQLPVEAVLELYRVRAATEREATRIAVNRMDGEDLLRIERAHDALDRALRDSNRSGAALSELNREFHFEIYRRCTPAVVEHIESLWARFPSSATLWGDHSDELATEHETIVAAIRAEDADRAGDLMAAHILSASRLRAGDRVDETGSAGGAEGATSDLARPEGFEPPTF